jgi:hypothetical protein
VQHTLGQTGQPGQGGRLVQIARQGLHAGGAQQGRPVATAGQRQHARAVAARAAGLQGTYPSLTDLDGGDLKFTTDFRGVYQELLGTRLVADTKAVLGGEWAAPGLVRA